MTTKIPSPKELKNLQKVNRQPLIDLAIDRISKELATKRPYRGKYTIDLNSEEYQIKDYLVDEFQKAGWNAKIESDQRDGIWIELKEAKES